MEGLTPASSLRRLRDTPLAPHLDHLCGLACRRFSPASHGDLGRWLEAVAALPVLDAGRVVLDEPTVGVDNPRHPAERTVQQRIRHLLMVLHPWRKGPFRIHGVHLDSEWRADWKWERLQPCISPLRGRTVLDVGCSNGYYGWRMLGAGASAVLGIDPGLRYNLQFQGIRHFLGVGAHPLLVMPLALEDLPPAMACFDSVFSMGVLAHRRSPLDHLHRLRNCLRPGGELVLETLVIEDGGEPVLLPRGRYARMRNVWVVPSCATLHGWLKASRFRSIELCNVSVTSREEQRRTDWMRFHSLGDFLDPTDPRRTVEGLPAPQRALFRAVAP